MAIRAAFLGFTVAACSMPFSLYAQEIPTSQNFYYRESRPANSYVIERSYDEAVCPDVLQRLNKTYWIPGGLRMPSDYAEIEAHYFLGTHENIRWAKRELQFANAAAPAELADIDLFNSGQSLTVLRRMTSVSSTLHNRLYLPDFQNGKWSVTEVGIDYSRERNGRITSDLSTGFSFPVLDIINSGGQNYVLLKPVRDVAPDARLYVLRLYGFVPNTPGAVDYQLMCTLMVH